LKRLKGSILNVFGNVYVREGTMPQAFSREQLLEIAPDLREYLDKPGYYIADLGVTYRVCESMEELEEVLERGW